MRQRCLCLCILRGAGRCHDVVDLRLDGGGVGLEIGFCCRLRCRLLGRRKRTIGIKEIETTIATMARIPPKAVSKDDAEVLRHLQETLKRVVYGQDKAIEALSASIKLARAGLRPETGGVPGQADAPSLQSAPPVGAPS